MAYHRAFDRRQYLATRHFYTALELDAEILGPGSDAAEIPFYALATDGILGKELMDKFIMLLSQDQRRTIELFFFEGSGFKGNCRTHRAVSRQCQELLLSRAGTAPDLCSAPKSAIKVTEKAKNSFRARASVIVPFSRGIRRALRAFDFGESDS